ncbi:tyrosinase family protein [Paraburkholderia sp. LEh10]|jgi:tyrosinase|uniref:tyrosinase family protein n=1 Tax=Paraburkholderia sp. LEh10 TaxID=2821353 RepID=UPI001AE35B83|nr:tyrosinase family protein [Paraburkholderia sp. LEh10]MBP0590959.1 tyrosinase family protein [Paraburkholderia sp. LEh10]
MSDSRVSRRAFLKGSASAAALISLPVIGATTPTVYTRQEWQVFKTTPQFESFKTAIRLMKAQTDATKPTSWTYWVNVHVNYCPHMVAYFLAWHRGYLYYFEQQLRTISGDNTLTLPYWDQYANPNIPGEFLDAASGNPLYVTGRVNSNISSALSLAPFARNVVNFQRGTSNSFEAAYESAPHNPIHNIIGGWMADMQSPTDPIFYLHHCNVDRLWDAWAQQPWTTLPLPSNSYWNGNFTYAKGLTMSRSKTYRPSLLNYQYANTSVPTALPPVAQEGRIIRVQAQVRAIHGRPPTGSFATTPERTIASDRRSLGGVARLTLTEKSVSAQLQFASSGETALQDTLKSTPVAPDLQANSTASSAATTTTYRSVNVVLDNVAVTGAGQQGGYYYNVYLNLPAQGDVDSVSQSHFLGTLGPFEISAAMHHSGGVVTFPATEVLQRIGGNTAGAVVSLVRVDGPNAPKGTAITVGELRFELSTSAP